MFCVLANQGPRFVFVVHMFSFMCPLQWIPHNNKQKPRSACPICLSTWRPVKHLAPPPFNSRSGRSRKSTRSQSQAEPRHPRNDECPQMPVCVVVISLGCAGLVVSWVVVSGACWTCRRLWQWQWMASVSSATASSQAPRKSRPHLHTCDQTHASEYDSHKCYCGKAQSDRAPVPSISMAKCHQAPPD